MTAELLSKNCASKVIRIFLKEGFLNVERENAVVHIIYSTEDEIRSEVATEAIDLCLSTFVNRSLNHRLLQNFELVSLALSIADMRPTVTIAAPVASRLVEVAAQFGFHSCFPKLPERLLGRSMNEYDISAIISAYIGDRSTKCEADEEKFKLWAKTYLPQNMAEAEIARLKAFEEAWESEIDF